MKTPYNQAFTLVELLVVIAIISLLASLILPTLNQARDTSLDISCINQQKQIGIAQAMYSDDNAGWIVRGSQVYNPTNNTTWCSRLGADGSLNGTKEPGRYGLLWYRNSGFIGSFVCPREPYPIADAQFSFRYTHYLGNGYLLGMANNEILTRRISAVIRPSDTTFLCDNSHRNDSMVQTSFLAHNVSGGTNTIAFRHGLGNNIPNPLVNMTTAATVMGMTNLLYFDGHSAAKGALDLMLLKKDDGTGTINGTLFWYRGFN